MMTADSSGPKIDVDLSISMPRATVYTLVISVPLVALLVVLYAAFPSKAPSGIQVFGALDILLFVLALVTGVFLHEAIHALGWSWFGHVSRRSIEFGFQIQTLTPYAHATQAMAASGYRAGTVLPAILLGLIPFVVGTVLQSPGIALFGIVMTFAAGGDLLVLWLMRNVNARALVQDHPSRAGCIVLEQSPDEGPHTGEAENGS